MAVEENNLPVSTGVDISSGGELQVAPTAAGAMQEIQAAIFLAKRFPRDEEAGKLKLIKACQRRSLAEVAEYSFPRGGSQVRGPSVNLARVAGSSYGNVRYGITILRDDDESMLIQGWAWDVENNVKVTAEDSFKKLIYRKSGGWIKPDERDLRELMNRRGAILVRNCILQIVPRDFTEDAITQCRDTLKSNITNLDEAKDKLIRVFDKIGVPLKMLREYVGHMNWSKEDMIDLQAVYTSIKDGNSKREDYFNLRGSADVDEPLGEANGKKLSPEAMTAGDSEKVQGYEKKATPEPEGNLSILQKVADLRKESGIGSEEFVEHLKQTYKTNRYGSLNDEQLPELYDWLVAWKKGNVAE